MPCTFPGAHWGHRLRGLAIATLAALGTSQAIQAQTPVALYTCDQSSGTTLTNTGSLGTAKNATITGTAAFAAGKVGSNCLSLNGSSYAAATGNVVTTSSSFTAAAWVKFNSLTTYQTVLSVSGTNVSAFFLQYNAGSGRICFNRLASDSTAAASTVANASAAPATGTWYHVAGVYNSSAKTIALYVNGALQATTSYTTGWSGTGNTLVGAGLFGGVTDYVNGYVDDARFYSSALTAAQITSIYNLGSCAATTIVPYVQINGGAWQSGSTATVAALTPVKFGPQPTTGGSWSWSGPGLSSTSREVTVTPSATSTFVATYTNACGAQSSQSFVVTISGGSTSYYSWPAYSNPPAYDYANEYGTIAAPTQVMNDSTGVAGTYADKWWCFRYGANKNSLVTSAAWVPMVARLNTDFSYITDTMRWPRDSRARAGYYSAVYLYGSGISTDTASNTDLGGWQSGISYNGTWYPMILASYYPVYSFDPACTYTDKVAQQGAMVHEGIHCILSSMPGCQNSAWFNEGGNTWLQGTMEAQRSGSYASMGFLSAAMAIAPFQPIECYTGWLQDGSFGGPSAEGVNMTNSAGNQVCTWRNLLGGSQYGECFPHALEVILGPKSIAWLWRYCSASGRVLQDLAQVSGGLGDAQTRHLITEFRGRQAMADFGNWSAAYKQLMIDNWNVAIGAEWSPYWINCPTWYATCYVDSTLSGSTLTPAAVTLPGWSGANQIPLTVSSTATSATVTFNPIGANMTCQLVYRDTNGNIRYSTPVSSGACTIPLANVKNNVIVAVVANTDYIYVDDNTRKAKFNYTLTIGSGVTGKAAITTQWFN